MPVLKSTVPRRSGPGAARDLEGDIRAAVLAGDLEAVEKAAELVDQLRIHRGNGRGRPGETAEGLPEVVVNEVPRPLGATRGTALAKTWESRRV